MNELEKQKKRKNIWKTLAIVFITISAFMIFLAIIGTNAIKQDEENMKNCYYDICEEYDDAVYYEGACGCYSYNETGQLELTKTTDMEVYNDK